MLSRLFRVGLSGGYVILGIAGLVGCGAADGPAPADTSPDVADTVEPDTADTAGPDTSSHDTESDTEEPDTSSHGTDSDTEEPDTSSHDTDSDTEEPDTSSRDTDSDTEGPDTSSHDTDSDTEEPDTAVMDTWEPDTQVPDTLVMDTWEPDTVMDTWEPDTVMDTWEPDTQVPDTEEPDTLVLDTWEPDTSVVDTWEPDTVAQDTVVVSSCVDPLVLDLVARSTFELAPHGDTTATRCGESGGPELVARLTLAVASDVQVDTVGSEIELALALRSGDCATGPELACSAGLGELAWSRLTLRNLAPGTYWLIAEGEPDAAGLVTLSVVATPTFSWTPLPTAADPLVHLPGTQPAQAVVIEASGRCLNCHAGYDPVAEPGTPWKGSMMAQASRDPIFWAAMTVAAQDSIWAIGRPNAVDLCERCHMPAGWLAGRSDPPNASAFIGADYEGVSCDFCHQMIDPFGVATMSGAREGSDWSGYWDEANVISPSSSSLATATRTTDASILAFLRTFGGAPAFGTDGRPTAPGWTEQGAGQYFVSPTGQKRAAFADAKAQHPLLYSRFHRSRYFCSSCHDVSNPALANLARADAKPGDGGPPLPSEASNASSYVHLERTFSEHMLSIFGQGGGATGTGAYAPEVFSTSLPNHRIATCQDCHMADARGVGANKTGLTLRPDASLEHPKSGVPSHGLMGGNAWVTYLLGSSVLGSPEYDARNRELLWQGPAKLTLDLTQGEPMDSIALLSARDLALDMLADAATIDGLAYDPATGRLTFRVTNHTSHKLPSGFPEGRRVFANVRVWDANGALALEVNPYDQVVGNLRGLDPEYAPSSPPLGERELHVDALVYEVHLSSSLTGEESTFHMVLADGRSKDNRVPPRGFRIADAAARKVEPVWHGAPALGLYTTEEYQGGFDAVELVVPKAATRVEVRLYYQTTSRDFIAFLRDQIRGEASTLPSPTLAGAAIPYVAQTDPFFAKMRAWGDTIWELWLHNKDVPGAAPVLMTQATWAR